MKSNVIRGLTLVCLGVGLAGLVSAQQPTLVNVPSSVTFNRDAGTNQQQLITGIALSNGQTTLASVVSSAPSWLTVESANSPTGQFILPLDLRIRVNFAAVPAGVSSGTVTIGPPLGSNAFASRTITVNLTGTGVGLAFSAAPTSLAFTQANATTPQDITISSNTGTIPPYTVTLNYLSGSGWLFMNPPPNTAQSFTNSTISVTANPSTPAGLYSANIVLTPQGIGSAISIPVTLSIGSGTFGNLLSSVSQLNLGTINRSQSFTVTPSPLATVPITISISPSNLSGFFSVSAPTTLQAGANTVTVTVLSPELLTAGTTANLTISGTGYNPLTIPITVNGGATQRTLTASPASITLNTTNTQQFVQITPSQALTVPYTAAVTPVDLQSVIQVSPATGAISPFGSTLSVTTTNPTLVAGRQANIVITPSVDSGFTSLTIPINSTSTGFGSITVSPASLTFNVTAGSSPLPQTLAITSSDLLTQHFFIVNTTSTSNFLVVSPLSGLTPSTMSVSVNPSVLTTPGAYSGSISITPQSGPTANVPVTIPVTVNVNAPFTVTATPSSATLTAPAGGAAVQQTVQLAVSAGTPAFTTSVTTDTTTQWLSVTSSSTTLPATLTISANPAGLTVGTYTGNIVVNSGGTAVANIPVVLTVVQAATLQVSPATLTFSHQTTSTSGPPAQNVQITSSGASLTWSATSSVNWIQVSPASGSTPGSLAVSVNPTGLAAGAYNGTVSITSPGATNSPQTVTVNLTVSTPAIPQINSIVNSASFAPTGATPGLIFTVFGGDLGPATPLSAVVSGGAIATTLGETRVLFDGIPAPILYTSSNQVSGVMPFELFGRFTTRMQLEYRGVRSREIELRVADTAPGIFSVNAQGSGQGAILNQNGTINSPSNPEARGNVVVIYVTGLGQTTPTSQTGRVSQELQRPLSQVSVRIGGRPAEVIYAGSSPGLISGGGQINVRIPADAVIGASVPVDVQVGSAISQTNITLAVR